MAKLTVDNGIVTKYSGNVTELTIPDGISEIAGPKSYGDKGIFEGHSELTSVILPEGLLRIGARAFEDCIGLTNIIIPASVKEIGKSAFKGCKGLINITIPDNVRIIEEKSFSGCSELLTVVISENAEIIEDSAFAGCSKLTKVNIPNSVAEIRYSAFEDCIGLTSVTFPDNQLKIGSYVFRNCSELTEVRIPDSVNYYGDSFKGCKKIIINGEKLFIRDSKLLNYADFTPDVVIPESVKFIGDEAFANHSEIISVKIPNSVEKIGSGAFKNCSGLMNITIPNSLTEIGSSAFKGCSGLMSITIPESVTKIEGWAFEGCSELTEITLPTGLSEIKSGTFRNCSGMTDITIPNSVTKIELTAFNGCGSLRELNIPASIKIIDCGWNLEKINRIIIDPDSIIERISNPEELLKYKYDISPVPMIPISAILEPENKIKFFFEYCKDPEKYPKHIAEEYEKYGRSQRSRILREAEKQNRAEVIAFYEKKGKKAAVRTLTPAEKAALMKEAFEKGTDEDLLHVLKKYKNIGCEPSMLEKAICEGSSSRVRIFLDQGIKIPERSNCISELLKSSDITFDEKKAIIDLCLSRNESKISVDTDCIYDILTSSASIEEKKAIVALCLSTDLLWDVIDLCYATCILNYREIIEQIRSYGQFPQYLPQAKWFPYTKHYRLFENLSEEQCRKALDNILAHSDPNTKPVFYLDETDAASIFYPDILQFIIEHFTIKWGNWPGKIILNAVKNNQPESLQMLLDYFEDNKQDILNDISDSDYVRQAIVECFSLQSKEMLGILYNTGWADPVIKKKDEYFRDSRGWKTKLFTDVITDGEPKLLEILISHDFLSELPSSFNRTNALRFSVNVDNSEALEILSKQGWIRNSSTCDSLIELASNEKKTNALAWLLEYKNKTSNPVKEEKAKERKEKKALENLDTETVKISDEADQKELWKTRKNADGTYTIDRYLGTDNHLTIPGKIGKRIISTIGKRSFDPDSYSRMKNCDIFRTDTSIVLSDGIKIIEDNAFYGFDHLTSVVIPESVAAIGSDAFTRDIDNENDRLIIFGVSGSYSEVYANKNNLRFVGIDPQENKIPDYAISKDSLVAYYGNDKNLVVPAHVRSIGKSAFMGHNEIESITLPEGLISIGNNAFDGCSGITTLSIPDSVKSIGNLAFYGCSSIVNINIPEGIENISNGAFEGCCSLTTILLPESAVCIGDQAFKGCIKLENINIPDSINRIGWSAFSDCRNMVSIDIPDGINCIDDWAFSNCTNLRNISLPDSIIEIGSSAFYNCCSLTSIKIPAATRSIGRNSFENCNELNNVSFSACIKEIGNYAFSKCSSLKNIRIPDSVTDIGHCAFYGCTGITDLMLPGNIKYFGDSVFSNCSGLRNVILSPGIKNLDLTIFSDCNVLEKICIPPSIKSLSVKFNRWKKWPEKLTKIVIDRDAAIEKVAGAEELLEHEFEISPVRMIPISAIEEPETKLRYFFEYCKAPDQYPKHIAESYKKYGKAQRARILREATAQNQTETIAWFEKDNVELD